MSQSIEYPYKPKIGDLLFGVLLSGIAIYVANSGLHKGRLFSVHATNMAFLMIMAVFGGLGGLCLQALLSALISGNSSFIRLTPTEIYLPQGSLKKHICAIPFQEVTGVMLRKMGRVRFLEIQHSGGKANIQANLLPNKVAFEEVYNFISAKTGLPLPLAVSSSRPG